MAYPESAVEDPSNPPTEPIADGVANGRYGARLCEKTQEPTRRRIVFSIALRQIAATALFLFRLTKSRRTFYAQIECRCFPTASGISPIRRVVSHRLQSAVSGLRTNHRVAGGGTEQRFLALSQSWRLGFLGRENVLI